MTNNRFNFGVKIDLLHDKCSRSISNRVNDVRDQAVKNNCFELEATTKQMFDRAMQLYLEGRYRFAPKYTTERYSLLRKSSMVLVLTYRYNKVKWEVETALQAGTPVCIYSPYKTPDMVKLNTVAQWIKLCDREANSAWAAWMDELDINSDAVMATETPWLGVDTLKEYANGFASFDLFMNQVTVEISMIEDKGVWDVDTAGSLVFVEKGNVWRDKDGVAHSRYKYANTEFWTGKYELSSKDKYEVLAVDIMTKFLHLTYLESINEKPMQRLVTDGVEYGARKFFEFLSEKDLDEGAYEQGLTLTPLYVDPYSHLDEATNM